MRKRWTNVRAGPVEKTRGERVDTTGAEGIASNKGFADRAGRAKTKPMPNKDRHRPVVETTKVVGQLQLVSMISQRPNAVNIREKPPGAEHKVDLTTQQKVGSMGQKL